MFLINGKQREIKYNYHKRRIRKSCSSCIHCDYAGSTDDWTELYTCSFQKGIGNEEGYVDIAGGICDKWEQDL